MFSFCLRRNDDECKRCIYTLASSISASSMVMSKDNGLSMQKKSKSDLSNATQWACLEIGKKIRI